MSTDNQKKYIWCVTKTFYSENRGDTDTDTETKLYSTKNNGIVGFVNAVMDEIYEANDRYELKDYEDDYEGAENELTVLSGINLWDSATNTLYNHLAKNKISCDSLTFEDGGVDFMEITDYNHSVAVYTRYYESNDYSKTTIQIKTQEIDN